MDAPPLQVLLCDVTLREGDQTPGVRLSLDDKLRIADILNAAGVAQIQLNHMTYPAIREEARVLKARGLKADLEIMTSANRPSWRDDVKTAIDLGADVVHTALSHKTA